ncbi:MAG: hypothetical protein Q7S76_02190 [bacterium]|nr:hypothetical protein [bacterium]
MNNWKKYCALLMLGIAISVNLWLYRLEPTALIDPNDNAFQYALVERTNEIWDYAAEHCGETVTRFACRFTLLADHWVPNWAQGYNLPYYYSHIPQILIVASHKFFSFFLSLFPLHASRFTLFLYYHWVIYLLLSFFPLSMFLALRVLRLPWLTAGIGALLASQISTDGLYGLDPPSFLWRGYGLSSQLFAMIWLPLAVAWTIRYFEEALSVKREALRIPTNVSLSPFPFPLFASVLFLVLTTMGHLGIGMMAFLAVGVIAISGPVMSLLKGKHWEEIVKSSKCNFNSFTRLDSLRFIDARLVRLFVYSFIFLSYWLVPIFLTNDFHNISFWDPVWKFNSYGWKEILTKLFNGDLFDFGRLPVFTGLVLVGTGVALSGKREAGRNEEKLSFPFTLYPLAFLLLFFLFLSFGRTTWGSLIDLIPGMAEFHLHRMIVGVHLAGLFLAPIGLAWIAEKLIAGSLPAQAGVKREAGRKNLLLIRVPASTRGESTRLDLVDPRRTRGGFVYLIICLFVYFSLYPQTIRYAKHNDFLIQKANENYRLAESDLSALRVTLSSLPPGRIYTGRGGGWGRNFRVAETPYYMILSTFGFPTILWLPETWSLNSDTEQYFDEANQAHYDLYNVRYVVVPQEIQPQPFWKFIKETTSWKLYEVETEGPVLNEVEGYVATGVRPAIVSSDKTDFVNVVRLWIQSDSPSQGLYPELTFDDGYPKKTGIPNFRMIDEASYIVPDGSRHSLFAEPPVYASSVKRQALSVKNESNDTDMVFRARVTLDQDCAECIVILKQTYHPNWRATVDGAPVNPFAVFPFFTAVPVATAGTHDVTFSYEPSLLKHTLILFEIALLSFGIFSVLRGRFTRFRKPPFPSI